MIDICVNLTNSQFRNDREQVIQNAFDAGITAMIVTGPNKRHNHYAFEWAKNYPGQLYATSGIHPHDASDFNNESINWMRQLAANPEVVAIGECGLDFNRNYSPPQAQLKCFEAQLDLAVEMQLPVYLHQRNAHHEFTEMLAKYRPRLIRAVAHCFTGQKKELRTYLDMDLHIGITGWICDERRGAHLRDLVRKIPLNRLMIETDAPYLLPRDIKPLPETKRNEPKYLAHICRTVAECLSLEFETASKETRKTTEEFFGLN